MEYEYSYKSFNVYGEVISGLYLQDITGCICK